MLTPAQSINAAISAYSNAAKGGAVASGLEARDAAAADGDFAGLVKGAINEAVRIAQHSEQVSIAAASNNANLTEVVTAVAEAEVALRAVVAVRDKVLEAYREIIRMPI